MESRSCATILLLVFGIIHAHSHPEGHNALDDSSGVAIVRSTMSETKFGSSRGNNFDEISGYTRVDGRFRRESKLDASEIFARLYKQDRLATIARELANAEAGRRTFAAALQNFYGILDGYVERGFTVEAAVEQLEIHHPRVANQIVGYQRRGV